MSLSLLNASALDKPMEDPHSSEHLIALQQLQEQLDSSKKQLTIKDQQLLEKDKKVRGQGYRKVTIETHKDQQLLEKNRKVRGQDYRKVTIENHNERPAAAKGGQKDKGSRL